MKKFLKWFQSSTKIKRWLFLMLIGIVLVCYGIAKVLVTNELAFKSLAIIVLCFVFGFTFVVLSMIYIQKRTLELFVQETDTRNLEKEQSNVNTLIFNKKVYNQGPKIVVIGGGSGLNTVVRGLKQYTDNITAIVTISDYGAPKERNVNPLDNVKDSLIALSNNESEMTRLFHTKFEYIQGKPRFCDLYFAAMEEAYGNFAKSIEASKEVLNITGRVLPVTLDAVTICAELEDGTLVESKEKIPEMVNEKISKIDRVYLSPTNCRVAPGVIEAIQDADAIVIGPGSIYTNVIPNLLVAGVSREIRESKAFKIYIGNIMTEFGQTDNFTLSDHIKAIVDHAGEGIIDYCIYDTGEIMPEYIRKYNKEGCELVEQDVNKIKDMGIKLIQRKLSVIDDGTIKHNSDAIATSIIQLICDELKFNDMQNNAQFIMLDSRVKDTKKKIKRDLDDNEIRAGYGKRKKRKQRVSKFFTKYNARIESIRESEQESSRQKKRNAYISKSHVSALKREENKVESIKQDIPNDLVDSFQSKNKTESKNDDNKFNKTKQEERTIPKRRNSQVKDRQEKHHKQEKHQKSRSDDEPKQGNSSRSGGKHSKTRDDLVNDKDFRNILNKMMK